MVGHIVNLILFGILYLVSLFWLNHSGASVAINGDESPYIFALLMALLWQGAADVIASIGGMIWDAFKKWRESRKFDEIDYGVE